MADTSAERLANLRDSLWASQEATLDLLAMIEERDAEIARLRAQAVARPVTPDPFAGPLNPEYRYYYLIDGVVQAVRPPGLSGE